MSARLPEEGGGQSPNRVFGRDGHFLHGWNDRSARERLALSEAYREEGLGIRYLVESFDRAVEVKVDHELADSRHNRVAGEVLWKSVGRDEFLKVGGGHFDPQADGDNKMVLVALVDGFDSMEILVPARIGLERVDLVDDVFGGDIHLSGSNGAFQAIRRLDEGESHLPGGWCLTAHHPEAKMVQGGPEVVRGVPKDEGEFVWNGAVGLKEDKSLGGIAALADSQMERRIREIFGSLPVQIVDVLFGPLDLSERSAEEAA